MSDLLSKFIETKTSALMKSAMDDGTILNKNDPTRLTNVRFSSFPFCGVRWFLDLPSLVTKASNKDFAFGYFTRVGTTVHEVIQEAFSSLLEEGQSFRLLWDWKCKSCKHREGVLTDKPPVVSCSACNSSVGFSREEHQIRFRGAVGHVDTVLEVELPSNIAKVFGSPTGVIVVDYKTTSTYNVTKKDTLPYKSNVAQISKYTGVLQKKLPVIGWALVYMPRDIPFRYKVFGKFMEKSEGLSHRKDIVKYVSSHKEWSSASTLAEIKGLFDSRPCQRADSIPEEYSDCDHCKSCTGSKGFSKVESTFKRMHKHLPIVKVEEG